MTTDHIHSPAHYMAGDYECHQIQDALASTLWKGDPKVVRLGNALKYLWRACSKGKRDEDLRKAATEILLALDEDWRMRVDPWSRRAAPLNGCSARGYEHAVRVPCEARTHGGSKVSLIPNHNEEGFCFLELSWGEDSMDTMMSKEDALKIGGALVAWAKGESK